MRTLTLFGVLLLSIEAGSGYQQTGTASSKPPLPLMTVDGTVIDKDGKPVPNALVTIAGANVVITLKTDQDGNYRVPLRPESATYTISATYGDQKDSDTRHFEYPQPEPGEDRASPYREYVVNLSFGGPGISGVNELDIYFVSRREPARTQPGAFYNGRPAPNQAVSYGKATMQVPRRYHSVELETPVMRQVATPNTFTHRAEMGALSSTEFYGQLQKPDRNLGDRVLVFVHGFDVTFEDALRQAAQLASDIGFRGRVVLYTWPSGSTEFPGWLRPNVVYDRARKTLEDARLEAGLNDLLKMLGQHQESDTIYVLAHSMGTDLAMRAVRQGVVKIKELIFAAPDIAEESFRLDADALVKNSDRFTLYYNENDRALSGSKNVNFGFARQGRKRCASRDLSLDCVDASAVRTDFWRHSYYRNSDSIVGDILQITCQSTPANRRGLETIAPPHVWRARKIATAIPKPCAHKPPVAP